MSQRYYCRAWSMIFQVSAELITVLVALELGLQFAGAIDFPRYDNDEVIGFMQYLRSGDVMKSSTEMASIRPPMGIPCWPSS
jgi:hypothetical protein